MNADAKEAAFQQDIIDQMVEGGWQLGEPVHYNRELALYTSDSLAYVQMTQPKEWEKYQQLYPNNPEQAFIAKLAAQLSKADPQASDKSLRTFGTRPLSAIDADLKASTDRILKMIGGLTQ